jgi:hypothetical protein
MAIKSRLKGAPATQDAPGSSGSLDEGREAVIRELTLVFPDSALLHPGYPIPATCL